MKRNHGFTLMELLVVMAIIGVLASLLIPALIAARGHAKSNAGAATMHDFTIALKAFDTDAGRLPADEAGNFITKSGAASVATVMESPGPKNMPYYQFKSEDFNALGRWVSPMKSPFKYRELASKSPKPLKGPDTGMNMNTFDMWTFGYGDAPACDPATSEPASAASVHNW